MTSQPPLLGDSGSQLPGPQFVTRPGWGGQLSEWTRVHAYRFVFRTLIIAAVVLIVATLLNLGKSTSEHIATTPTPSPVAPGELTRSATAGEGVTHLAARALDSFLAAQQPPIALPAYAHLCAVDTLARTTGWRRLALGESITFSPENLSAAVEHAQSLTPTQQAAWARILR